MSLDGYGSCGIVGPCTVEISILHTVTHTIWTLQLYGPKSQTVTEMQASVQGPQNPTKANCITDVQQPAPEKKHAQPATSTWTTRYIPNSYSSYIARVCVLICDIGPQCFSHLVQNHRPARAEITGRGDYHELLPLSWWGKREATHGSQSRVFSLLSYMEKE